MYGIYHTDNAFKKGWSVQLQLQSGRWVRWFGAYRHGGMDGALKAAKKHRDELLPLIKDTVKAKHHGQAIPRHDHFSMMNIQRQSPASRCVGWRVYLRYKGKSETKTFSDSHYGGYEGSLQAAKEYRDYLRSLLPRK